MTDQPYTDTDLRAEAARQHRTATEDPDFMGVGEQMEGQKIASADDLQWDELDDEQFDTAMRGIEALITGAADTSQWAIDLGADGLEPDNEHTGTLLPDGKPIARIHYAFAPDMPEETRTALIEGVLEGLRQALNNHR
ncbi:hypothetical protein ABT282_15845 [Streptomyces sp. NPDC000927]|uniref:hypothetical protein n=1 Tax=Streptomyces sp. NPDC000927 TaxID=3154371 RepID=UPI0033166847